MSEKAARVQIALPRVMPNIGGPKKKNVIGSVIDTPEN